MNWYDKDPGTKMIWNETQERLPYSIEADEDVRKWCHQIEQFKERLPDPDKSVSFFLNHLKQNCGDHLYLIGREILIGKKLFAPKDNKSKKKTIKKKADPEKHLNNEETKRVEAWLALDAGERYGHLDEIINFYIKGESSQKLAKLIFFLLLGDILSKDLISKIDFHGDSSTGKSYMADIIASLMPEENYIKMTNASPKALIYDSNFGPHIKFIYLRELTKNNIEMVELSKALYDGNINYLVTNFEDRDVDKFTRERTGFLSTYSYEYTQRDAVERAWLFTTDSSYFQHHTVINYRLARRSRRIEFDYKEEKIKEKIEFLKNIIRYLRDQKNPTVVIPFAKNLKAIFEKNTQARVRRDVDKLPDIIEIIALWNQKHRQILEFGNKEYLFAEYYDLKYATTIGLQYFIDISRNLDKNKLDILGVMTCSTIKAKGEGLEDDNLYTITKIYNKLKEEEDCPHKNTIRNKMKALTYDGYLEKLKGEKGKADKYRQIKEPEDIFFDVESVREEIIDIMDREWDHWKNLTPQVIDYGDIITFESEENK